MNSLFISRINNKFTFCFLKMPCISYLFHEFTRNTHGTSRIHYDFTIYIANALYVREYTMNSLWIFHLWARPLPSIYYKFTILFANQVSIYCLRENTMNFLPFTRIHYESTSCFAIYNEFTIYFVKSLWIHYLFRKITIN